MYIFGIYLSRKVFEKRKKQTKLQSWFWNLQFVTFDTWKVYCFTVENKAMPSVTATGKAPHTTSHDALQSEWDSSREKPVVTSFAPFLLRKCPDKTADIAASAIRLLSWFYTRSDLFFFKINLCIMHFNCYFFKAKARLRQNSKLIVNLWSNIHITCAWSTSHLICFLVIVCVPRVGRREASPRARPWASCWIWPNTLWLFTSTSSSTDPLPSRAWTGCLYPLSASIGTYRSVSVCVCVYGSFIHGLVCMVWYVHVGYCVLIVPVCRCPNGQSEVRSWSSCMKDCVWCCPATLTSAVLL